MKNFVCFILVFLCICANQTLLSQKINDSISTKILDEVIVSATKTLRQLSTLPLPAKLISKEEIIKSNSSRLSDILDDQIGIFVVPDFGGGNGIQMQGLDSEYTLVLIDGFPIIGRQSGTLDLERIAVGNIEKIEIIKGSSSGLYGTDAIGGVINLITKKTNEVVSLESSYKISSFNTLTNEIQELHEGNVMDLIVMGTKGASGLKEVLFGSNTVHVIKNAKC